MEDDKTLNNPQEGTQDGGNPAGAFYDSWGLSDEDKGFIQSSKYADPAAVIKALRDTKAYVGADKNDLIRLPKADKDGNRDLSEVYKQLGRPEKAEDYGLGDTDFAKAAADKLFELGLSAKQAKALSDFMVEQDKAIQTNSEEEWNHKVEEGVEALKKEWGANYEVNKELAQKAVRDIVSATGLTVDELNKIESALGTDKATKLFYSIGAKEGGIKNLQNYNAGEETPEIAQYKIAELKKDKEFVSKMAQNDPSAIKEMKRLTEIAMRARG
jgi:hypothetical protein